MDKKCLLLLLAFFLLMLGGCAEPPGASAGKIIPPSSPVRPLEGKWAVLQELDINGDGSGAARQGAGNEVQFAAGAVAFGGHVWDKLSYKIKKVNTDDYLMTKYIPPAGISVPQTRQVEVITVHAASNYLGEFMKLDAASMIFFVQDKVLLLKKISDQADSTLVGSETNDRDLNQDSKEGTSGVLLGLRIPEGAGYTYQTLWIAVDHYQLHPVLTSKQLFFPRTSGFWELNVQDSSAGKTGNILTARNAESMPPEVKRRKTRRCKIERTQKTELCRQELTRRWHEPA